jgi:DNA-binding transcriptional LysR family regulator
LLANERVDLHDLIKYKFILTHAGSQSLVQKQFARAGLVPRITHELSQLWSILDFVSRGQGVSMVASLALPDKHQFPGIATRPISPRANRNIGLACRDVARLTPAASAFWRMTREALSAKRE